MPDLIRPDLTMQAGRTLGVALTIPHPYRDALQAWHRQVGDVEADAIPPHITLLPPTDVDDVLLQEIGAHLARAASSIAPFTVALKGTETFRPLSPVVFISLVEGMEGCERLEREIRRGPLARDLAYPYHPHVTVAHDVADALLDQAHSDFAEFNAEFNVEGFTLFQHLGERWEALSHYRLG
jgi:2'-5' RNA ligase